MKIDDVVAYVAGGLAALFALVYLSALFIGVVKSKGLLLPVFIGALGVVGLFVIVLKQRLSNPEDDYYDRIER